MAEAVVGVLISKIGTVLAMNSATFGASLLCKEASALKRLFGEICDIKEELEIMQAFLRGAERFKDTEETTKIFVKKIRGIAFEIEDVVDEFTYKFEDKHGGFTAKMKKRMEHAKTWQRLALKLQEIKRRLKHVDKRIVRYNFTVMDKGAGGSGNNGKSANESLISGREDNLVGIDENKKLLLQWLTDDPKQQSIVASVLGMGGVGKTTLVAHVYNILKTHFDAAAWVTVSSSYQIEDLFRKIAREFCIPVDVANMEMINLVKNIHDYLRSKKFVLVLDDVWGVEVWFKVRDAFPTDSTSRFLITSRILEVASLATGNCVLQLEPLELEHSWELFCREAFWKSEDKRCPLELQHLAHMFVEKCKGLPIAIACLGRLLSCKQPTYAGWENVYKDVNIILKVSLEDLPYELKNCFMHCAIFPEDFLIKRRRVIRHWITAGFIIEKGKTTLEDVAEGYLNELVNRSLLQVVGRNEIGRLKYCRMHDIIRILALNKANEEWYCDVLDGSRTSSENSHHLSIQSKNIQQLSRYGGTHLRALYVFENEISIDVFKPILTSSNLLSFLDLQETCIHALPNEVFDLFNLCFLGLRNTAIECLPEAIGRLQNLEVLDACETKLVSLPDSIAKLRKLRYLYALTLTGRENYNPFGGVRVPTGIKNLTGLRALQCVKASRKILREVGVLKELRTFGVSHVRCEQSSDLCSTIMKMNHLIHLEITALGEEEVLQLEGLDLPITLSVLGL
uniref:NB-ARC domain-containing protein n=1 Tax=Leersia perrieri TaxID=77586 RepID=A0A0D9WZZ1_9ORYZ